MKFKKNLIVISLLSLSLIPLGNSTWVTFYESQTKSYSKSISTDVTKVAYTISDSKVITYYLTIESALEHTTSGTVYVIPGTNPTITRNCEIKSGVTLCIPYDDNGDGTHSDYTSVKNQSNDGFADKDAAAVAKNRKNLVTIKEGITLTNNGTLDVAGKVGVGNGSQRPTGFTLGDYCEILMESNAKIQNNGSINLYGYIKESSSNNGSVIENHEGSVIYAPLAIYDFKGGSFASAANDQKVLGFSYFDFPNCHVNQIYKYGSKLIGRVIIYANKDYNKANAIILGAENEEAMFKMSNGSEVCIKYSPKDCFYTTLDVSENTTSSLANYTYINIKGDLTVSSLEISGEYTFTTAYVECPICYKYQITQESGTLTISNKMKFLSGSSLTIREDAKCVINAPVSFYQGYSPKITLFIPPQNTGRATFIVDGELTLNSDFGGVINSTGQTGKIKTGTNFINNYTTTEMISYTGSVFSAEADNCDKHVEYAEVYKLNENGKYETVRLEKENSYDLSGNFWDDLAVIDISSLTLSKGYGKSESKTAASYEVTAIIDYYDYSSYNLSYNWTIDPTIALTVNNNVVKFTTPAASSNKTTYTLTCTLTFNRSGGGNSSIETKGEYIASYSGGCVLPTARVLMADGTYREAMSITTGDMVISFNHETGKFEPTRVLFNDHANKPADMYDVLHLEFDNGKSTDLIYEHGCFDLDENKYVYIRLDNYFDYIGHRFVFVDNELNRTYGKLVKANIVRTFTKLASIGTANHINAVVDDMLSMAGALKGLFNIFEYDPSTLAFDKDKMQRDIDKYGLLDYEYFKDYFPKEIYDLLPCKYLGVSIGKGLITWDIIKSYIAKWKDQLMENMK